VPNLGITASHQAVTRRQSFDDNLGQSPSWRHGCGALRPLRLTVLRLTVLRLTVLRLTVLRLTVLRLTVLRLVVRALE
jgi:hypothetical protein